MSNINKGNTHTKNWGHKFAKQAEVKSEIRFFTIFSSSVHLFSFKVHRMIAWNNEKLKKNVLWGGGTKLGPELSLTQVCIISFS